jgi:hypothetical protein
MGEFLGGAGSIGSGWLMSSSVCRFVVMVDSLKSRGSNLGSTTELSAWFWLLAVVEEVSGLLKTLASRGEGC